MGLRVLPQAREVRKLDAFGFMGSTVSSEKPKAITVREVAAAMRQAKAGSGRILVVAGPAVIHTGSSELFSRLVRNGYVHVLFAGNALAAHDIEQAFFGTSLGVSMEEGRVCEGGTSIICGRSTGSVAWRHRAGRRNGAVDERDHVRMCAEQRPVCSRRQYPRRWTAAGSHHRRAPGTNGDAREDRGGDDVPDDRHGAAFRGGWQPFCRPVSKSSASTSTPPPSRNWPTGGASRPWDSHDLEPFLRVLVQELERE